MTQSQRNRYFDSIIIEGVPETTSDLYFSVSWRNRLYLTRCVFTQTRGI